MLELFDIPHIITTYGYIGSAIIIFLESGIFFALPGDSLLFTAGLLAIGGVINVNIYIIMVFVFTLLGSLVGYYIGVHLERLRRFGLFRKFLKDKHIIKAEIFMEKYGRGAILISKFIPIVRTFLPIVAGIAKMPYKTFLRYTVIASALWPSVVIGAGYLLGHIFPGLKEYLSLAIFLVVGISLLPVVTEFVLKKKKKIADQTI